MGPFTKGSGADTVTGGRPHVLRVAGSLTPWWWTLIGAVVVAAICLAHLQSILHDSVYASRVEIVARGMGEVFPYFLVVGAPILFASGVANLTRDRGWVSIAPRAAIRGFLARVVGAAFLRGWVGAGLATVLIIAGAYAISFEPSIQYVSLDGPSFAPDLSVAHERYMISDRRGAGILTPLGDVSLVLFYAVLTAWTGLWGGAISVFAVVCVCVSPWPRIALVSPLIWIYALQTMVGFVSFGIGAVSPSLAMFPLSSSPQLVITPILASVLYLAPAVLLGAWGWKNLEKLPGFR